MKNEARRSCKLLALSVVAMFLLLMAVPRAISYVSDDLDFEGAGQGKTSPKPDAPAQTSVQKGKEDVVPSIDYRMVYIPPGTFVMGSPINEPGRQKNESQHQVTLTKGFYMGVTEVTQGQWRKLMRNNPSFFQNCGEDCPVENVSWNDVQEFIRKLNATEKTDKFRLPTEAEWEYACRAGSAGAYAGDLDSMAWYGDNSGDKTHRVGQKKPNAWGLHDMHGNVWECCDDSFSKYPSASVTDPKGPSSGSNRVVRGGSWVSLAEYCRSADRFWYSPGVRFNRSGFRLARTVD